MVLVLVFDASEMRNTSTTEAEYVALADIVQAVPGLKQVWLFMLPNVGMPCMPAFEDNEGEPQLAQNPVTNSNSKPLVVRHNLQREPVGRKESSVIHVLFQHKDFLIKAIPRESFQFHLAVNSW